MTLIYLPYAVQMDSFTFLLQNIWPSFHSYKQKDGQPNHTGPWGPRLCFFGVRDDSDGQIEQNLMDSILEVLSYWNRSKALCNDW